MTLVPPDASGEIAQVIDGGRVLELHAAFERPKLRYLKRAERGFWVVADNDRKFLVCVPEIGHFEMAYLRWMRVDDRRFSFRSRVLHKGITDVISKKKYFQPQDNWLGCGSLRKRTLSRPINGHTETCRVVQCGTEVVVACHLASPGAEPWGVLEASPRIEFTDDNLLRLVYYAALYEHYLRWNQHW